MNEKRFFAGLTALVLSIGVVLAGCESPTAGDAGSRGNPGDPGVNPPNVVSTFRGIKDAFDEGNKVVYLVGPVDEASNWTSDLTLAAEQTLVIATNADIKDRSVAGSSVGSLTIPEGKTLTVNGGKLTVNTGATLAVAASGVLFVQSGELNVKDGTLSLAAGAGYSKVGGTVDASPEQSEDIGRAESEGPVRTTNSDSAITTLINTEGVTTVIYSGNSAIPAGSGPKTVPANKTLRVANTSAITTQNTALTVDGTLIITGDVTTFSESLTLGASATATLGGVVTTFSAALTLGAGATAVLAEATTVGAGAIAIGAGGTLVLLDTTTLSAAVTGPGSLVLDGTTSITGAFGATKPAVSGAGTVSTTQEGNLAALLVGFDTVTYDATTLLSAATGAALTSGKTLVSIGSVAQSAPLALGGGIISITTNAITASATAVSAAAFTGTGLITVSAAAGLDLGAATAAPTGVKLQTTGASGTITTATTSSAVLGAILALNDGGTGKYASTGNITAIAAALTIPAGVTADSSSTAGATFATGNFKVTVNGALKVNPAASFAEVGGAGGITIGNGGELNIGVSTAFAPNGASLAIVSEGAGKLVTAATSETVLAAILTKAGTPLNVELSGTSVAAAQIVKVGTVLTLKAGGVLAPTTAAGKDLTVNGEIIVDGGSIATNTTAGVINLGASGKITAGDIVISGEGSVGAGTATLTIEKNLITPTTAAVTLTSSKIVAGGSTGVTFNPGIYTFGGAAANQLFAYTASGKTYGVLSLGITGVEGTLHLGGNTGAGTSLTASSVSFGSTGILNLAVANSLIFPGGYGNGVTASFAGGSLILVAADSDLAATATKVKADAPAAYTANAKTGALTIADGKIGTAATVADAGKTYTAKTTDSAIWLE